MLEKYYALLRDVNFEFIISCDVDDASMNNPEIIARLDSYPFLRYFFSENKSKVEAINNNMEGLQFDVLLLASDDMEPVKEGYDKIIKDKMNEFYPDTDGVLWFNDGFQKGNLNTLVIMGKAYYDRFNYIYHPSYKSLYCDLEFTAVSGLLNKSKYFDEVIIKHVQYSIVKEEPDALYIRNDMLKTDDLAVYQERRMNNFSDKLKEVKLCDNIKLI
jgi:hypothetical protein